MCDLTDPRIVETYTAIVEGSAINWLTLGYNDTRDVISLYSRGSEGLIEFRNHLTDEVLYGFLRIDDKFLLITWVPEQVSGVRRARALVHSRSVATLLKHHHTQLTASTLNDLNEANLRTRLKLDGNLGSAESAVDPVVSIPVQRQPSTPGAAASPISPTGSEPNEEFLDTSEQFSAHQQPPPVPPPRKAMMASSPTSPLPPVPTTTEDPAAIAAGEVDDLEIQQQQQQHHHDNEEQERQLQLQQQQEQQRAEEEEVERQKALALEEEEKERQRQLAEAEAQAAAAEAQRLKEEAERKAQEEAAERERLQKEEEQKRLKEQMAAEEQRRLAEEKKMIQQRLLQAEKNKDVVLSGYVSVQPSKSPFWRRRYFTIKDKTLTFYRDELATHPILQVDLKNVTRLSAVNVDVEPFIPNAFVLETPQSGAFQLFADDKRDMETIVTALQTVM